MIFVDTSFWLATIMSRDGHHSEAVALLRAHQTKALLTTNHVRGETWTFLRRRAGHAKATEFLDRLAGSRLLELHFVEQAEEDAALGWLRRHDEREYSFVDATSFQVMKSMRIRDALTFDGDFSAAGFNELRV